MIKDYHEPVHRKAIYIVPSILGSELADYIFGAGSGSRLHSGDNFLLLHQHAERHFDQGAYAIIPADISERSIKT